MSLLFFILVVQGTPYLIVGHHLLTGKVVKLERPLAIMDKVGRTATGADLGDDVPMDMGDGSNSRGDDTAAATASSAEYVVTAVIRRKVIFKIRPKPIVTKKGIRK